MAFVVCLSRTPPHDHGREEAAYLDQAFYELIFAACRADGGPYPVLREIASLRYKSPTLVVRGERLDLLDRELDCLGRSGAVHPQIEDLHGVCRRAREDGLAVTVSGDMYPEL